MSTRGTRPKPAALKLLNGMRPGTDSGGRRVEPAPGFARRAPDAPDFLTGEALDEWNRVVPELERLQLLKPIDRAGLTAYVLAWQRLVEATRQVRNEGYVIAGAKAMVRNPACGIITEAARDLRQWIAEFGLSPSAEGRLVAPKIPELEDDDIFD